MPDYVTSCGSVKIQQGLPFPHLYIYIDIYKDYSMCCMERGIESYSLAALGDFRNCLDNFSLVQIIVIVIIRMLWNHYIISCNSVPAWRTFYKCLIEKHYWLVEYSGQYHYKVHLWTEINSAYLTCEELPLKSNDTIKFLFLWKSFVQSVVRKNKKKWWECNANVRIPLHWAQMPLSLRLIGELSDAYRDTQRSPLTERREVTRASVRGMGAAIRGYRFVRKRS